MCQHTRTNFQYHDRIQIKAIIVVEFVVFVLSLTATWKHLQNASGRFTNVAVFHVAHAGFCATYVAYQTAALVSMLPDDSGPAGMREICLCDPFNCVYLAVLWFYTISWHEFLRYWKRATLKIGASNEWWQLRFFAFVAFNLIYGTRYVNAIMLTPCSKDNFNLYGGVIFGRFIFIAILYVTIDSSVLAFACVRRFFSQKRASYDRRSKYQTALFICLPSSLLLGLFVPRLTMLSNGQEFLFCFPSIIMLGLMWKRHYISLHPRRNQGLEVDLFARNDSQVDYDVVVHHDVVDLDAPLVDHSRHTAETGGGRSAGGLSSVASPMAALQDLASFEHKAELSLRQACTLVAPLASALDCSGVVGRAEKRLQHDLGDLTGGSVSSADPSVRTSESEMVPKARGLEGIQEVGSAHAKETFFISEVLAPSDHTISVAKLFLTSVALPKLDQSFSVHVKRSAALVADTAPRRGTSGGADGIAEGRLMSSGSTGSAPSLYGDMERHRQHAILTGQCKDLTKKYAEFVALMRITAANMSAEKATPCILKRSSHKKLPVVAPLACNLNVHATTLNGVRTVVSTTFGAPSAHSLGFAHGGLRQTLRKLDEVVRLCSAPGSAGQDPATRLRQLELRFHARAREAVVMGQALGGVVTAAVELLAACLAEKRADALRQVYNVGLLVHSACLLSTAGSEEAMLDDFAGAYAGLNVTLCLARGGDGGERGGGATNGALPPSEPQGVTVRVAEVSSADPSTHAALRRPSAEPTGATATATAASAGAAGDGGRGTAMGSVRVVLHVSPRSAHDWVVSKLGRSCPEIRVIPVLFNLGVNEAQSVANVAGSTDMQTAVNRKGVADLEHYFHALCELVDGQDPREAQQLPYQAAPRGQLATLLGQLKDLVEAEARDKAKAVDLLLSGCFAARLLNGARTTSCKSAKDRTSMFQTLEVCRLAGAWGLLDPSREQAVLDRLRGPEGVRLRNAELNTGKAKYAFNALQLAALPRELRPPPATAAGGAS